MQRSLGLYLHLPFCIHHCGYCDFVVREIKQKKQLSQYLDALKKEIALNADVLASEYWVDTIYLGGGTPSLYAPTEIQELLSYLSSAFHVSKQAEISMEANPTGMTLEKFEALQGAGINRLSMGVQSFHPHHLNTLERRHTGLQALEVINRAKRIGFDSLNLDLIFGIPDQTLSELKEDIEKIASISPDHLSIYQLTLSPENPLFTKLPSDDRTAEMYQWLMKALPDLGYIHYEISSFAKPGHHCKHNLKYWHLSDFLGLGVGAYSRLSDPEKYPFGLHIKNLDSIDSYMEMLSQERKPIEEYEVINKDTFERDYLLTHFRLLGGISAADYEWHFQESFYDRYEMSLQKLKKLNLLDTDEKVIKLTPLGVLYLNQVLLTL